MENENKNVNPEMEQPKQPQGWKDVQIVPDMPVSVLINFLNVLNQRLCTLEDVVKLPTENGQTESLTEIYRREAEKAQAEAMAKAQEEQKGE